MFQNRLGRIGAHLQNLLKLFEWIVQGGEFIQLVNKPASIAVKEKVIY